MTGDPSAAQVHSQLTPDTGRPPAVVREPIRDRLPAAERNPTSHDPDPSARHWHISTDDRDAIRESTPPADAASSIPPSYEPAAHRAARAAAQPADAAPPVFAPQARARGYRGEAHASTPQAAPGILGEGTAAPQRQTSPTPFPAPATARNTPHAPSAPTPTRRRHRRGPRIVALILAVLLVLAAWPLYLVWDANRHLTRVDALSGAAGTPGTTYLLAGSDSRAEGPIQDETEGQRSDSTMLINVAPNGQTSMVSLPRDTYVDVPGYGWSKLNAAYSWGGPALLVQTVEALTGLTVDHYVEIGMGGVADIVDAVGGIELCMDMDVQDAYSGLNWTAGCHQSDGTTALAFSRMRYSDPRGDIGRAERQRQVVSQTVKTAMSPSTLLNPSKALQLERAGAGALTVDSSDSVTDVARLVLAFRKATSAELTGAPPLADLAYPTGAGEVVLLRDDTAPDFFAKVRDGSLTTADLNQTDF